MEVWAPCLERGLEEGRIGKLLVAGFPMEPSQAQPEKLTWHLHPSAEGVWGEGFSFKGYPFPVFPKGQLCTDSWQ